MWNWSVFIVFGLFISAILSTTRKQSPCPRRRCHRKCFLKDRMRMLKDSWWFIGLTDDDIEGVWKWFDTDEMATFTDFMPGDGGNHTIEDCVAFCPGRTEDYHWVDITCSASPLCETRGHEEASVIGR